MHVHLLDFHVLDRLNFTSTGVSNYLTDRRLGQLKP